MHPQNSPTIANHQLPILQKNVPVTQRSQHPGGHGRGQGIYPLKVSCCTPAKKSRCRPRRDRRGPPTPKVWPATLHPYVPLRGGARLPMPAVHHCVSPSRGTRHEHPRCRGRGLHGKNLWGPGQDPALGVGNRVEWHPNTLSSYSPKPYLHPRRACRQGPGAIPPTSSRSVNNNSVFPPGVPPPAPVSLPVPGGAGGECGVAPAAMSTTTRRSGHMEQSF